MAVLVFVMMSRKKTPSVYSIFGLEYLLGQKIKKKCTKVDIRGRPVSDWSHLAHTGLFSKRFSPDDLVSGPLKHYNTYSSCSLLQLPTPVALIRLLYSKPKSTHMMSANAKGLSMLQTGQRCLQPFRVATVKDELLQRGWGQTVCCLPLFTRKVMQVVE